MTSSHHERIRKCGSKNHHADGSNRGRSSTGGDNTAWSSTSDSGGDGGGGGSGNSGDDGGGACVPLTGSRWTRHYRAGFWPALVYRRIPPSAFAPCPLPPVRRKQRALCTWR